MSLTTNLIPHDYQDLVSCAADQLDLAIAAWLDSKRAALRAGSCGRRFLTPMHTIYITEQSSSNSDSTVSIRLPSWYTLPIITWVFEPLLAAPLMPLWRAVRRGSLLSRKGVRYELPDLHCRRSRAHAPSGPERIAHERDGDYDLLLSYRLL